MPDYSGNNPYDPNNQYGLGGSYAFGNGGPSNFLGLPVAYGGPSASSLANTGLPQNMDPNTWNALTASSNSMAPFVGQEQQLANSMQNLNPNQSVGANLWQNQGLGDLWSQQAAAQQQQAYDLAKSYASGAATPAQQQLQQAQQTGNALSAGNAQAAGGGARGAAAAQGALQDQAGATSDMQRAGLAQQKAADQQQYTAEAAKLGNQLYQSQLGYQQGNAAWQNSQAQLKGQYQQLADQASLGAGSMLEGIMSQQFGLTQGSAQQYLQQQEQNAQVQQQLFGAGMSGAGAGFSQAGRSGGGDSTDNGSPYGLGNNAENPWWNG